jgi:hypothetical protein
MSQTSLKTLMSPKHFIFTLKKHVVQPIALRVPPNLVSTIKIAD